MKQDDGFRPIVIARAARGQIELHRHIGDDAAQLEAQFGVGLARDQRVPGPVGLDFVQVGVQVRQRFILLEQIGRALLADAAHPWDVVRLVAHQRLVIHQLVGAQAIFLLHAGRVVDDRIGKLAARSQDADMPIHHLQNIAVAGHDQAVHPLAAGLAGQCRQHIIGLEPLRGENRDVEGLHHLLDALDLRPQLVRHPFAVALVAVEHLVPEGLADVERDRDILRLLLAQHVEQHGGEAKHRVGQFPVRRGQRQRDRVERAKGQAMAVNQDEGRVGHTISFG